LTERFGLKASEDIQHAAQTGAISPRPIPA